MGSTTDAQSLNNRLRALIVDDDKMMRKIHTALLTMLDIDFMEAENGKKAVDICRSGELFDLILMDHDMPVMNGSEATRLLREMEVSSMIVGVSGLSTEIGKQTFKDAGLNDFYEKPLALEKLKSVVREIYNR